MTRRQNTYAALFIVAITSAASIYFARYQEILQVFLAIPFAGSLLGVLVQVLRDQAAYEHSLLLQESGNRFALAVSSHMGNVAFDRHVEFSEAYIKEAQSALVTLVREGPSEGALRHSWALPEIREKFVLWLTFEMEQALIQFEAALREIGAKAHYVEAVRNNAKDSEARSKALQAMYGKFAEVMGFNEWEGRVLTDELAIAALVRKLRTILGTEEIMLLRSAILLKASNELRPREARR